MEDRHLCKAKRKDNEEWVEGYIAHCPTGEWEILRKCDNPPDGDPMWRKVLITHVVDPSTICKCTGLKDKNGKLIWENDIAELYDRNTDYRWRAVVRFGNPNHEYTWGWQLEPIGKCEANTDILCWIEMEESGAFCEVIGSAIDNMELLEAGKEAGEQGSQDVLMPET